jgi:two-component system, NtrC family, sensor kinase
MRSARILVLDDDPAIGELLGEMLRLLGHSGSVHLDAAQALSALQDQHFDLILCDYRMPGMQGNEFYREVYLRQPDLARRIVFLTGDMLSEDTQFFVKATGNPHLLKPFRFANVRDLLQRVLDEVALDPASERKPV